MCGNSRTSPILTVSAWLETVATRLARFQASSLHLVL
jgi:hypothetical protein